MLHKYRILIQEKHLDTFGHVNNATYLELYEEARWDMITARGYGLDYIQKVKQGPVILNLNLSFRKELCNRQEIVIETWHHEFKGSKIMLLKQHMLTSDGSVASELTLEAGLMDLAMRKLIAATPQWLKAMGLDS